MDALRRRVAHGALVALTAGFGLNFTAGVFFPLVTDTYGIEPGTLAAAAAASTVVAGLAQPLIGLLLDRLGARRVLAASLSTLAASYLVLSAAHRPWQFVTAYVLLGGLGFAGSSTLAVSALIGRWYGPQGGPVLSRAAAGINLGQLLVPGAATALLAPLGLPRTYLLVGLAGLAGALAVARLLPADPPPTADPVTTPAAPAPTDTPDGPAPRSAARFGETGASPSGVLTGGAGRRALIGSLGLHAATLYVLVLLLPRHATDLGWAGTTGGRLVVLSALAAAASTLALSRLLLRHRPETLLRALHLVRAAALTLAAWAEQPATLIAVAVLFGVSSFPILPLTMTALSRTVGAARLGRMLAPAMVVHQLSAGAGLLLAAVAHAGSGSYRPYFAVGIGFSLLAALLLHHRGAGLHRAGGRATAVPPVGAPAPAPAGPGVDR